MGKGDRGRRGGGEDGEEVKTKGQRQGDNMEGMHVRVKAEKICSPR